MKKLTVVFLIFLFAGLIIDNQNKPRLVITPILSSEQNFGDKNIEDNDKKNIENFNNQICLDASDESVFDKKLLSDSETTECLKHDQLSCDEVNLADSCKDLCKDECQENENTYDSNICK